MILLLDNYDSFTYNLAQYLGELGCNVEVHRNDKITVEEIARRKPERIVISPGPCTPQEAGVSVELIERLAGKFPILGVCLGHQAIGAALSLADRGAKIAPARTHHQRRDRRWHHHGPPPPPPQNRRRPVPPRICPHRIRQAAPQEFLVFVAPGFSPASFALLPI